MEYRTLGRTGVKVSPICLGTDNYGVVTPEDEAITMINTAIDAGINLLDTANVYESEPIIGKALAQKRETPSGLDSDQSPPPRRART